MSPSLVQNGGVSSPAPRVASVYSEVQASRIDHALPLPSVLKKPFKLIDGPASSAAGNPEEIAKLFPNVFGQPSAQLVESDSGSALPNQKLKIGVVLSGGQAPGGHNVISGIFDYLQDRAPGSTLYGFRGGPAGIMKGKYVELTPEYVYPYRNQGGFDMICSGRDKIETPEQFKQAQETAVKLDLDGLVVIGGDDSNTNACLLAENFKGLNLKTRVIGCPKTIDGDLKCKEVPTSFGFDTACKIYSEMIGNVMIDARSTGKYYHFVRLMGRAASHITLECALQTHPNITIIGEEVAEKKQTLKNVTDYIVNIILKRADFGYNYGVILIPEGLIDFIPEVQELIAELNEILAHDVVDEDGLWKKKLTSQSLQLFELLPGAIQEQLMLETKTKNHRRNPNYSLSHSSESSRPPKLTAPKENEPRGGALMSFHLSDTIDQAIRQLEEIEAQLKTAMSGSKKLITREEWEKKLNDVKIKKEDMNKLVMNFFVTEGYVDAAEKFRKESGTEPDIDLATITERMAVKKAVQCGNVEDAIDKMNDLNPEILDTNPQLCFHLQQQRLIELIRNGKVEEAIEFAQEELAPRGEENQSFLEELERTVALLAFEDVSNCPVGELLDISQRLKTASEVNAAILTSQSHEKDPKLPSLLKMLVWAQNQLDEKAHYPRINDLSTAKLEDPSA